MGVVLQATGRIRPYTQPREIFTFQCAAHPYLSYTQEFHCLGEAREFFGIPTRNTHRRHLTMAHIQQAKAAGLTQRRTAQQVGVSLTTVKRYWHNTGGYHEPY